MDLGNAKMRSPIIEISKVVMPVERKKSWLNIFLVKCVIRTTTFS